MVMSVSLIIPTFNESKTVSALTERIVRSLDPTEIDYDIWFVDDSADDTPAMLAELSRQHPRLHYVHRDHTRGLGSAIVEGFSRAKGEYLIVMDADLQHPPEYLPDMIRALKNGADIVIPSRFIAGGSDGGLNIFRKAISWTARTIGQCLIKRLRTVSDCTSGYFGLKRQVIDNITLVPDSWKILIEILVKGQWQRVKEIPYPFQARRAGESKMSIIEQWKFLKHLFILRQHQQ